MEHTFRMDQQSLVLSRLSLKNKSHQMEMDPVMKNIFDQNYNVNLNIQSLNNWNENNIQNQNNEVIDQINLKKVIKTQEKLAEEKNTFEFLASGRINQRKRKNHRI